MPDDMLFDYKGMPEDAFYWVTYCSGTWSAGTERLLPNGRWENRTVYGDSIEEVKRKLQQPEVQRTKLIKEVSKLF